MTSIDPSAQLAALIRSQVASFRKTPGRPAAKTKGTKKDHEERDIAALVTQRVGVIDPNDPQRERKAFKIFLESVLIAELGEELVNDPAFYAMVEEIQKQMEADPELAASMRTASNLLLNGSTAGKTKP
jgi:hypothetical protein